MARIHSYPEQAQRAMREVLENEDLWPQWPYLPLKRPNKDSDMGLQLGVMFSRKQRGTSLYEVELRMLFESKTKNVTVLSYPTADALFEDDWVVD